MNYKSDKIKKSLTYQLLNMPVHLPAETTYHFLHHLGATTTNGKEAEVEWLEETESKHIALQSNDCPSLPCK